MVYVTYVSIKLGGIFSHKMKKYFIIFSLWLLYPTFYPWTRGHILELISEISYKWYNLYHYNDILLLLYEETFLVWIIINFSKLFKTHTSYINQLILLDLLPSFLEHFFQESFKIWSLCVKISKAMSWLKLSLSRSCI